ncbi:MAG: hypothetical protein ACAI38_20685 [Myxococcota bacterium]
MAKPDRDQKLETAYLLKKTQARRPWAWTAVGIVVAIAAAAALWFSITKLR